MSVAIACRCVFVSQSGETADTLRALEYAKAKVGRSCRVADLHL